jgi:Protein of unknown function (DUF1236)
MKAKARILMTGATCLAAAAISLAAQAQTNNPNLPGTVGGNPATNSAGSDTGVSGAVQQKPLLSPAQRSAIYAEVIKDPSKSSPQHFSAVVGADVPPMIELYALPDDATAVAPAAKLYKYTMVDDKVVVVDPTKMRIVDVIGPSSKQ